MKRKFLDTKFALLAGMSGQMPRVLRFAVENRHTIISEYELQQLIQPIRTILKTPMAEFFDRLVASNQLGNFAAICITDRDTSLPEIIATPNITLDLKQVPDTNILRSIPELRDRCLVNLTSVLQLDKSTGRYTVKAVDNFQNTLVKGHLMMSYEDTDGWLTPYLAEFTVKTYSMILSSLISRFYNLTLNEQMKIGGILALFYCQLLSRDTDNLVMPPLFNRCRWLGSGTELEALADACAEYSGEGLDLDKVCYLISAVGPEKLKNFNLTAFMAICGTLAGADHITSKIAIEYPPFWVWLLLIGLSGSKIPLIYQLNANKLVTEGKTKFLNQLTNAQSLFDVKR